MKIVDVFDISFDSLVLDDSPSRLPKIYRGFAELLADCDIGESEQILQIAIDFKEMLRKEQK